jgi:SAM-dependent methyltransferase
MPIAPSSGRRRWADTSPRIDDTAATALVGGDHARAAYDTLAPHYDAFTANHDYERWTTALENLALRFGLAGRRLLDIACGTGKSFLPFLERGYEVTACDVSASMVRQAIDKAQGRARVEVCDMRSLPALGTFDLVCLLDDAVNYLLSGAELRAALTGIARNLAPGGVAVFDVNSLRAYRTSFASMSVVAEPDRVLVWEGHADRTFPAGGHATATLEVITRSPNGRWCRQRSVHHQRHHPRAVVHAAIAASGLRCAGLVGMHLDGSVTDEFHETRNTKAVYIARRRAPGSEGR